MKFLTLAPLLLAASVVAKEYPYCEGCEVVGDDDENDNKYGVENQDWCLINESKCEYSECPNCNAVHVDSDGLFGIDNNNWCYMRFSKCDKKLPVCDTCKVYNKYQKESYGQEDGRLCKISKGKCSYPECPHCDATDLDTEGLFGLNGNDWCYMSLEKCGKKLPICKTCEAIGTYKGVQYGKENNRLCKIRDIECSYSECPNCDAKDLDPEAGLFGINGTDWCYMSFDKCNSKIPVCKTCTVYDTYNKIKYGKEGDHLCRIIDARCKYPLCEKTCEILYSDKDAGFGIENGEWCVVAEEKCKK